MSLPESEKNYRIDKFDMEVLQLICSRTQEGEALTWHSIEIRIPTKPNIPRKNVLRVLDELEKRGLIKKIENKPFDKWLATDLSKSYLERFKDTENQ